MKLDLVGEVYGTRWTLPIGLHISRAESFAGLLIAEGREVELRVGAGAAQREAVDWHVFMEVDRTPPPAGGWPRPERGTQ